MKVLDKLLKWIEDNEETIFCYSGEMVDGYIDKDKLIKKIEELNENT